MDVRYNMIQWVHRATRGWSYGEAIVDPRTGEIIKGQVTLGSLRSRQDYLIAEALLSPYAKGKPVSNEMREMVLARIRQLAAHEVGHTLGLQHNFVASSIAPGTSVMDYPHPWITLDANGRPDLAHAYAVGVGAWDKLVSLMATRNFLLERMSMRRWMRCCASPQKMDCCSSRMKIRVRWGARILTRICGITGLIRQWS